MREQMTQMSENYEREILQLRNNGGYISETNS